MDLKWFVLLVLVAESSGSVLPIAVDGNGYTGVIVAINRKVLEDLAIIRSIENLFRKSSPILYTATRNNLYFKEVWIVIPETWSSKGTYENMEGDFFTQAHFRVDGPNPLYLDEPYTDQPGDCGERGQFVHYTPGYLKRPLSLNPSREKEQPEKRLVQEWAHLRYGVFDEFGYVGSTLYPTFVKDPKSGDTFGTSCSKGIEGTVDTGSSICKFDPSEHIVNIEDTVNCSFIPDEERNTVPASLMFSASVPSIVHFCDDDQDGERLHNYEATNKQNAKCNLRSTWDVISSNVDFDQVKPGPDDLNTEPKFRYIQPPKSSEMKLILVLDISASMKGEPMELLTSAASRCIKDHFLDGGYLGLVSFSTRSRLLAPLTLVEDKSSREQLIRLLPRRDDNGYTAIGRGLTRALEAFKLDGKKPEGGRILLVTDGEENITPHISEVIPDLIDSRVVVSAIAFGNKASEKLENLTSSTGGKMYLFADVNSNKPPSSLDYAFLEATTVQADVDFLPITITQEQLRAQAVINERFVYIERTLGKNTVFTLKSPDISRMEFLLTNADGRMYTHKSREYDRDDALHRIKITVKNAKPGMWTVTYTRKMNINPTVELSVHSSPADPKIQPVRVRSWTSDAQLTYPATMKLYAEVKKHYIPVIKASVRAIVTRPNAPAVEVRLRDDGAGPDQEKDDGIYTAYFTNFTGSGRYGVLARVLNDGTAQLKLPQDSVIRQRRSVPVRDSPVEDEPTLEAFERVANGGVFRLDDYTVEMGDVIPPARVTDLAALDSSLMNGSHVFAVQWTSSGDDMNTGQAAEFELRASLEQQDLRLAFNTCFAFTQPWIMTGHLTPNLPGRTQKLTVKIPEDWAPSPEADKPVYTVVYFAMKTIDFSNNTADLSNIARAYLEVPVLEVSDNGLYLVVTAVAGGIIVLLAVISLTWLLFRWRNKRRYKSVAV